MEKQTNQNEKNKKNEKTAVELKREAALRKINMLINSIFSPASICVGGGIALGGETQIGNSLIGLGIAGIMYLLVQMDRYWKVVEAMDEELKPKKDWSIKVFKRIHEMFSGVGGGKHDKYEGQRDQT